MPSFLHRVIVLKDLSISSSLIASKYEFMSYVKAVYNLFLFDNIVKKRRVQSYHHYFIIVF